MIIYKKREIKVIIYPPKVVLVSISIFINYLDVYVYAYINTILYMNSLSTSTFVLKTKISQ